MKLSMPGKKRRNKSKRFTTVSIVWVAVEGPFELIDALLRFLIDEKIPRAITKWTSGNGTYGGAFTAKDARRIKAWLRKNGVKESDKVRT